MSKLKQAAEQLLHLHSCEQEGLRLPKKEQWLKAVDDLADALIEGNKPDFSLLEEYDMKDKCVRMVTHCLTKVSEANRVEFLSNFFNGMLGSAILHFNNKYVKQINVPDFKTTP